MGGTAGERSAGTRCCPRHRSASPCTAGAVFGGEQASLPLLLASCTAPFGARLRLCSPGTAQRPSGGSAPSARGGCGPSACGGHPLTSFHLTGALWGGPQGELVPLAERSATRVCCSQGLAGRHHSSSRNHQENQKEPPRDAAGGCDSLTSSSSAPARGWGEKTAFVEAEVDLQPKCSQKREHFAVPSHTAGPAFRSKMRPPNWSFIPLAFDFSPERTA